MVRTADVGLQFPLKTSVEPQSVLPRLSGASEVPVAACEPLTPARNEQQSGLGFIGDSVEPLVAAIRQYAWTIDLTFGAEVVARTREPQESPRHEQELGP